ncbi:MAG: YgaP family membrane protein [Chloroflexota bacterium]
MRDVAGFLASTTGRVVRGVAGVILIALGLLVLDQPLGLIVAVIGLVPLAAGVFDFCLLAPLFGLPFQGKGVRQETHQQQQ